MAKSSRSKIKQKFKGVRRKEIYKPVEDARLQRLAVKQKVQSGISQPLNEPENLETIELDQEVVAKEKVDAKQTLVNQIVRKSLRLEKLKENKDSTLSNSEGLGKKPKTKKKKVLSAKQRLRW